MCTALIAEQLFCPKKPLEVFYGILTWITDRFDLEKFGARVLLKFGIFGSHSNPMFLKSCLK